MNLSEIVTQARSELSALTSLELSSTLGVRKGDDGIYHVLVEMVEKKSLPDSMDILAVYELLMDGKGEVLGLKRLGLRKRVETANVIEEE